MVASMSDPQSSLDGDVQGFARELQQAATSGGFDPFSMLSGQRRFHSVFLAPPSPALDAAVRRFLEDGDGPLAGIVEQIKSQGVEPAEAAARARALFQAAQGMLVVVLADDQGLLTIPQLFFGRLDDDSLDQAVKLCGDDFPDRDGLRGALIGLRSLAGRGATWPALFGGVQVPDRPLAYWEDLGERLIGGIDEGLFAAAPERLADLAHWTAKALGDAGAQAELDGDQLLVAARCHLLAGEIDPACTALARLLADYEPEDEQLAVAVEQLAQAAIARHRPERALRFFTEQAEALDGILGGIYELALPRFKVTAASMADAARLIAAAEGLQRADRKAFKHDLNREPLWRCAVEDPGEVLDTGEAADLLDRSITFVAKRLEQGTIPFHRSAQGELRIPKQALLNWKAMMDHFQLLD